MHFIEQESVLNKEQVEGKEFFGKDIEIHAYFVRHGEKKHSSNSFETSLSEKGQKKSEKYGENLENQRIKAYSSDTERTKETAGKTIKGSPANKKIGPEIRKELGVKYSDEYAKKELAEKMKILGENYNDLPEEEKKERLYKHNTESINRYLSYGDKKPDQETDSPVELAAMLTKRVDIYLRQAERLKNGSKDDIVNVTHDYSISAFLKEVMIREVQEKKIRGFNSVEEIGGPIDYNEGFEISIKTDSEGKKSVGMDFRGKNYEIDMHRLEELKNIASKLEKEKARKAKIQN